MTVLTGVRASVHLSCWAGVVWGLLALQPCLAENASPPGAEAQPPTIPAAKPTEEKKTEIATVKATAPAKADLFELPLEKVLNIPVLQTVVTTVARRKSTVGHSPAAVFVITPEMIERSGATTIPELLRMVPGMDVARIDNNKWAISARGFNERFSNKLLVQIDGRTAYNPIFSGVFWDTVDYPLEDIERIEVVRGPGASVWGANAVNGVINIITKSAQNTQGGLLSGGGGGQERGFGELRYGGKSGEDLFYRVYAKGFDRDHSFSETSNPHDDWSGGSAGARFDWLPCKMDTITFDGGYLYSAAGATYTLPTPTPPFSSTGASDEITNSGHVLSRWTRQFDSETSLSVQAYWDHFQRRSLQLMNIRYDTVDVDAVYSGTLCDRHKIVAGLDLRFTNAFLGPDPRTGGFVLNWQQNYRNTELAGMFAQDEISLIRDKLVLRQVPNLSLTASPLSKRSPPCGCSGPRQGNSRFGVQFRAPSVRRIWLTTTSCSGPRPSFRRRWGALRYFRA